MTIVRTLLSAALLLVISVSASAQYQGWQHSGSIYILTTPDGSNLPDSASEKDFPLLVRLHKDSFDFSQAKENGQDIRFSTSSGTPLAYQIEEWDAAQCEASIWVRIPMIKGKQRQEIKLHWGKPDAASESNGSAVFNESNGYVGVWHMNEPVKDEVGTLKSKDVGTTSAPGIIGTARHFAGKQGIFGGDKIPNYPSGSTSHTTEAWFRATQPNATILGWGNEGGGRGSKIRMQFRSPPHIHIDSDFSDVNGEGSLQMSQWIHVVHTYDKGEGRIYLNGRLDASAKTNLAIKSPARLWIGGWYDNYDFVGDIDEVRISRVARSADWIRLEYENQNPLQTLVGSVVQTGSEFSVSQPRMDLLEGATATVSSRAGGAQKVYWVLKKDGVEAVAAVDRFSFTLPAGRVTADTSMTLTFKAIYPDQTRTIDIPVTIREDIPEPVVTLKAPSAWNGRDTIEVIPTFSNLDAMKARGAGELNTTWTISGGAVIKEITPEKLILKRSQYTGNIAIQAAVENGGAPTIASATIAVTEPKRDAWVQRTPDKDEKPQDNQFYARDDRNEGTLYYNGSLDQQADAVFLNVFADDQPYKSERQPLAADKSYAFSIKLKPGLIKYRVEFGAERGGVKNVLHSVGNLVCGDAYIIQGQSNAVAENKDNPFSSEWVRGYGCAWDGAPDPTRGGWGDAVRIRTGGKPESGNRQIGYWGMDLAHHLSTKYKMPICILNGAVGGTRIDQHQRNPQNPIDPKTIYGQLLLRVQGAKLTHGIRGVLWHQGENNQGSASPSGDYDWKSYQQYFVDLSAAWKQDYPNIQHYYVYQIRPNACSMGGTHAGDMLLEMQRTLPRLYSNMRIMSTLGIEPGASRGLCHFDSAGYAQLALLMEPLIEQDNYGLVPGQSLGAPNLTRAYFASDKRNQIVLEFDQPMTWKDECKAWIYLDGVAASINTGKVSGNRITLELSMPVSARSISYLSGKYWDGHQDKLLYGANRIAALTFCDVRIDTEAIAPSDRETGKR